MTTDPEAVVRAAIAGIAPEADLATLDPDEDMPDALDLDSMDFANLIVAIHNRTKVAIPETDYNKLFTLGGATAYLQDALTRAKRSDG